MPALNLPIVSPFYQHLLPKFFFSRTGECAKLYKTLLEGVRHYILHKKSSIKRNCMSVFSIQWFVVWKEKLNSFKKPRKICQWMSLLPFFCFTMTSHPHSGVSSSANYAKTHRIRSGNLLCLDVLCFSWQDWNAKTGQGKLPERRKLMKGKCNCYYHLFLFAARTVLHIYGVSSSFPPLPKWARCFLWP